MKKGPAIMQSPPPVASGLPDRPQWLLDRLEWFQDLKFGVLLDWGPHGQWGCNHWPIVPEDTWARPDDLPPWVERGKDLERFRLDYWALNRSFNPRQLDPAQWAELISAAGMRYAAFTTKFHYGFCMFDTRQTDYRVTHPDCPFHADPRADVAKAVFDAFRERGLGVSCYFSKSDWHSSWYWDPTRPPRDRTRTTTHMLSRSDGRSSPSSPTARSRS